MLPLLPALGSSTERCRAYAAPDGTHRAARTGAPCFSADVAPILALSGSAQPSNALSDMGYYIAEQRSYTKVKSALLRYTLLSLSWAFLSRSCLNVRFFSMGNFEYASVALHYWREYTSLHTGQNRPLSCYFCFGNLMRNSTALINYLVFQKWIHWMIHLLYHKCIEIKQKTFFFNMHKVWTKPRKIVATYTPTWII